MSWGKKHIITVLTCSNKLKILSTWHKEGSTVPILFWLIRCWTSMCWNWLTQHEQHCRNYKGSSEKDRNRNVQSEFWALRALSQLLPFFVFTHPHHCQLNHSLAFIHLIKSYFLIEEIPRTFQNSGGRGRRIEDLHLCTLLYCISLNPDIGKLMQSLLLPSNWWENNTQRC